MSQIGSAASRSSQASLKPSCPAGAKRLLGRAAVGAALLASCLHAGAASALSFNFSFTGNNGAPISPATVTGVVSGLVDNVSNQTSGLTLTISSATNTPFGGWSSFTDGDYLGGDGFDVSGGVVTGVNIFYANGPQDFSLGNQNSFLPTLLSGGGITNQEQDSTSSNSLVFTPVGGPPPASVPGPLPLFGAGAAFGWSRRLRRKIKASA